MRTQKWVFLLLLPLALPAPAAAQKKAGGEVFTDPAKAGPEFTLQGEYAGDVAGQGQWAAQVVALGGGAFDVHFLKGGLPGAGWDAKTRTKSAAKTIDGKTTLNGTWNGTIADGKLIGKTDAGEAFILGRVERKSPTLGAKPPPGAIVLFDGTNTDAWDNVWTERIFKGAIGDKLLGPGHTTKKEYRWQQLHVEFRTPFKPQVRGMDRGNSGVSVGHEIQVVDSFGSMGEKNECGAFYGQTKPLLNMCLPPLSWQTYDLEWKAGNSKKQPTVLTVRHNGVVIHENYPVGKPTSTLHLQNHWNAVAYRNIWLVEGK